MRNVFIVLLVIITTVIITLNFKPSLEEGMIVVTEEKFEELQVSEERLQKLNQSLNQLALSELTEYLSLNKTEETLTSDDLISKIFLLLLTQLPLNLSPEAKKWLNQTPSERKELLKKAIAIPSKGVATIDVYEKEKAKENAQLEKEETKHFVIPQNIKKEKQISKELMRLGYIDSPIKLVLPRDIVKDLWSKADYKKKLNDVLISHVNFYEGDFHGSFFNLNLDETKVTYNFLILKNSIDRNVKIKLKLENQLKDKSFLHFEEEFKVFHPSTHNNFGQGPCRGLVLKNENFQVYLMKYPSKKAIIARILKKLPLSTKKKAMSGFKTVGTFLLTPKTKSFPPFFFQRVQGLN